MGRGVPGAPVVGEPCIRCLCVYCWTTVDYNLVVGSKPRFEAGYCHWPDIKPEASFFCIHQIG